MDIKAKIRANVVIDDNDCWRWQKSTRGAGYSQICVGDGKATTGHRASYEAFVGPIPEGYEIDHKCKVRICVNPAHLEAVVHAENIRRSDTVMGVNARKTECKRGHPLSGENLNIRPNGARQCRCCLNMHARNAKKKNRSAA